MSKIMTMKRPRFLGTTAQIIGAQATIGRRHQREATARTAIAKAFEGQEVLLVKNGSRFCVFTDPDVPEGLGISLEGRAKIEWAGDDGSIVLSRLED